MDWNLSASVFCGDVERARNSVPIETTFPIHILSVRPLSLDLCA